MLGEDISGYLSLREVRSR